MKKQKIKNKKIKIINKNGLFLLILFLGIGIVYAIDTVSETISTQTSTLTGSNSSKITFSYPNGSSTGETLYINKGDNSAVIGNYFKGYYYDSVFGFFKLDWSASKNKNVRVIGSTSKCSSGYGYKLGGYAYSEYYGLIDFNYSSDVYVYYCLNNNQFYGYSYSKQIGFQSFEGIGFDIVNDVTKVYVPPTSNTGVFTNDDTDIDDKKTYDGNTSNYTVENINGDIIEFNTNNESIFYIIK